MTFVYELDPYSLEIHRMCSADMNFLPQGFRKLSSDRQTCHTDRQTDKQTDRIDRNYKPRRFAKFTGGQ